MKIYDISQELFGSYVYPGDPKPQKEEILRIEKGGKCNLTAVSMCCHNGTHVDAPFHFISDGKTIDKVDLQRFVGYCKVIDGSMLSRGKLDTILEDDSKKILLKGDVEITIPLAQQLAEVGIELIGVENCTVGNAETGERIHKILLSNEIVILEGIRLSQVKNGKYFLCAQPVNMSGVDGAPCRAILIEE